MNSSILQQISSPARRTEFSVMLKLYSNELLCDRFVAFHEESCPEMIAWNFVYSLSGEPLPSEAELKVINSWFKEKNLTPILRTREPIEQFNTPDFSATFFQKNAKQPTIFSPKNSDISIKTADSLKMFLSIVQQGFGFQDKVVALIYEKLLSYFEKCPEKFIIGYYKNNIFGCANLVDTSNEFAIGYNGTILEEFRGKGFSKFISEELIKRNTAENLIHYTSSDLLVKYVLSRQGFKLAGKDYYYYLK